jgi:hypothetical protein
MISYDLYLCSLKEVKYRTHVKLYQENVTVTNITFFFSFGATAQILALGLPP